MDEGLKRRQAAGDNTEQRFINWLMQFQPAKELRICDVETMAMMVRSIAFDEFSKAAAE